MRAPSRLATLATAAFVFAVLIPVFGLLRTTQAGSPRTDLSHIVQAAETPGDKVVPLGKPAVTGTPAAVLDDRDVDGILGKSIRGSSGESMGRIVDVLVSRSGDMRGAVIDFGGFLGVGSRKIAVEWGALRFGDGDKRSSITVELTRDQLRVAPEYKAGEPVVILGAAVPVPSTPPPAADK